MINFRQDPYRQLNANSNPFAVLGEHPESEIDDILQRQQEREETNKKRSTLARRIQKLDSKIFPIENKSAHKTGFTNNYCIVNKALNYKWKTTEQVHNYLFRKFEKACSRIRPNPISTIWALDEISLIKIRMGMIEDARKNIVPIGNLIEGIDDHLGKCRELCRFASLQRMFGNIEESEATFDRIISDPNYDGMFFKEIAIQMRAIWQIHSGNIEGAIATIAQIKSDPCRDNALKELAIRQINSNDIEEANTTIAQMESTNIKIVPLAMFVVHKVKLGVLEEANKILREFDDTNDFLRNCKVDIIGRIVDLLIRSEKSEEAKEFAKQISPIIENITNSGRKLACLFVLANARIKLGDIDGANETAQKIYNMETTSYDKIFYLEKYAKLQIEFGYIEKAKITMKLMMQTCVTISNLKQRGHALSKIIPIQIALGEQKMAQKILFNMHANPSIDAKDTFMSAVHLLHRNIASQSVKKIEGTWGQTLAIIQAFGIFQ